MSHTYETGTNRLHRLDYGNGDRVEYTYDSLIYELSADSEYIYVWAYDNAGNIRSRTEYALLGEDLGEPLDTVVYEYTDSQWGDLLTSFDGRSIPHGHIPMMPTVCERAEQMEFLSTLMSTTVMSLRFLCIWSKWRNATI